MRYSDQALARTIDHTLLKPEASQEDILNLCQEAKEYGFKAVCVQPCYIPLCVEMLKNTEVSVATVVGFPLGSNLTKTKAFEASLAFSLGAHDVDMVINIGYLKCKEFSKVYEDIEAVVKEAQKLPDRIVKVIIETALLTREEKISACQIAMKAGAHFVKTSTGFCGGGATVEDVLLMNEVVGKTGKVKASGGIKTREQAELFLDAKVARIGTSSGVSIIKAGK